MIHFCRKKRYSLKSFVFTPFLQIAGIFTLCLLCTIFINLFTGRWKYLLFLTACPNTVAIFCFKIVTQAIKLQKTTGLIGNRVIFKKFYGICLHFKHKKFSKCRMALYCVLELKHYWYTYRQ